MVFDSTDAWLKIHLLPCLTHGQSNGLEGGEGGGEEEDVSGGHQLNRMVNMQMAYVCQCAQISLLFLVTNTTSLSSLVQGLESSLARTNIKTLLALVIALQTFTCY